MKDFQLTNLKCNNTINKTHPLPAPKKKKMKFSAWMLVVFLFLGNIEVCQAVKIILLARFITRFCSNYCILDFCLIFTSRLVISNGQFMGSVAHILNKYWCSITALTQNLSSFSFFYFKILVPSLRKFSWFITCLTVSTFQ